MSKPSALVIYGAGGFAREVLDLIQDINAATPTWDIRGFLDDDPERWGTSLNEVPVLGGLAWLDAQEDRPHAALGVGSPALRRRLAGRLRGSVASFPAIIHPGARVSSRVRVGEGAIVTAGNVLTNNIQLARFAVLNLMCTVGHDAVIGEFVTVSPGVNISGNVTIGEGCDIGTGSAIVQGVSIGEWTIVGAGAVVAKDLPANCTAVGMPARAIKFREVGWQETSSGQ